MSKPRRVVKRVRFEADGAQCLIRVYTDNTARIIVDHPSNDPVIEGYIGGRIAEVAGRLFAERGLGPISVGPIQWRNDPDGVLVVR